MPPGTAPCQLLCPRRAEKYACPTVRLGRLCQGIAVDFLVHNFDLELRILFGDQYNETTTFLDLAVWLWGPRDSRFERTLDLFGHVRMMGSSRGGEECVSLCTAIEQAFPPAVSGASHFISWSWRCARAAIALRQPFVSDTQSRNLSGPCKRIAKCKA